MQEKIRPGYKQTEIGVVPEDWICSELDDFISFISYGFTNPMPTTQLGPYMVTAADVAGGRIDFSTARRTSQEAFDRLLTPKSRPRKNDILLTKDGALGRVALVGEETVCINQSVAILRPNGRVLPEFLSALLQGDLYQKRMLEDAGGSTIKHIYITIVNRMPVAVPSSIHEQRAIAEALSDADARIAALETLIAKKRDLKQAAMQQLLTGKTRLQGFSGAWEVKPLGEIGEVSGAGVDKKVREGEQPVRLVNYMDAYRRTFIQSSDLDHWVTAPQHQTRRCTVEKGDVFFTPSSETRDDIANSAVAIEDIPDAAYSYHVVRLRIKDHWDLHFRAYAFQTRDFLNQAQMICDGSGTRYVISLAKFRGMTVKVPEVKEQAAIAEILSDMDAELAALDAEAEKARTIKQGMMQNLLTGKVRLV